MMQATGSSFLCVGIGEVLWDQLPGGSAPGGAPANFAWHAQQLGADARIVSAVGRDAPGASLVAELSRWGLRTDTIGCNEHPTGAVAVSLDRTGSLTYQIREHAAWDHVGPTTEARSLAAQAHAICFGTLGQRAPTSRQTCRELVAACPGLRVFDCNLRQGYWSLPVVEESLRLANVFKLNSEELETLAPLLGLRGDDEQRMRALADRYGLRAVALTRAAAGSALLLDAALAGHGGSPVDVVDTVGAGDAWCAALVMGILRGHDAQRIATHAQSVASFTCTRRGAMVELPPDLRG